MRFVLLALLASACSRGPSSDSKPAPALSSTPAPPASSAALPEAIPSFTSGPAIAGTGFSRREYSRGAATVTVTLGRFPVDDAGYAEWVRQSGGYPQAKLDVPAGAGNGFYECDDGGIRCNLLIQLRSGAHLEIRGDGGSTRADVDAVAAGLPLRALGP